MKKAMTLTEVLVIVAIIAILSTALYPALSQYLPGVQLNGSTRVLTNDLREAQEKAVSSQKQYAIRFSLNTSPKYYQEIQIYNGQETVIKTTDFPANENIILSSGITNEQIVFSADGGPSSSGNITLQNSGTQKIINVSPAGFIKNQ